LHSEGFGKRQDTNKQKAGLDRKQGDVKVGVKSGAKKAGAKGRASVGAKPKKAKPVA